MIESALTLLGSAGIATLAARFFAHRENIQRLNSADSAVRRREEREQTQRTLAESAERERRCEERCDELSDKIEQLQSVTLATAAALGRCEGRHDAIEERMIRLERRSDHPAKGQL